MYIIPKNFPVEIVYCDTLKYEHPDNRRFLDEVSRWLGHEIKIIRSDAYSDIMDVFRRVRFIKGPHGAPCTKFLKQRVRMAYSRPDDIHVLGYTVEEESRIERFKHENPDVIIAPILAARGINKQHCYQMLKAAGIELPRMYRMGYRNNNCIGCVKGGMGYWNKIRRDFPKRFYQMAALEQEIGATVLYNKKGRIWLTDLDPLAGRYEEEDIDCGVLCTTGN